MMKALLYATRLSHERTESEKWKWVIRESFWVGESKLVEIISWVCVSPVRAHQSVQCNVMYWFGWDIYMYVSTFSCSDLVNFDAFLFAKFFLQIKTLCLLWVPKICAKYDGLINKDLCHHRAHVCICINGVKQLNIFTFFSYACTWMFPVSSYLMS